MSDGTAVIKFVESQVAPLRERIADLERKLADLENRPGLAQRILGGGGFVVTRRDVEEIVNMQLYSDPDGPREDRN